MAEPRPDIHELFCHYNSLYFSDELCTCIVSWDPCLTSMESSCSCVEEGLCEIQLSVPLLKGHSSADLKNILLHEMIHAFLWIRHKNNNHSDHGSKFWNIANSINSNLKVDHQRPGNGYNITTHHGFQNEAVTYSASQQKCLPYGDLIERGMDEEPFGDCIEKNGGDNYCGNLLCRWHKNQKPCPDRCERIDDVSGFKDKGKSMDSREYNGRKHGGGSSHFTRPARPKLLPEEELKDKRAIKRPKIMAEYLLFGDDYKPKKLSGDDKPKNSGKNSHQADCSNSNEFRVADLRTRSLAFGPEIPRQPRSACRKISNLLNTEVKYNKREREISLVMQLFGVYTDEESEEDLHPLINKRSERRKRMTSGFTPHEVISLD